METQTLETKPGPQTTEFWLTIFGSALNVLNLTGIWDFSNNKYSLIAQAIITALYSLGRGQAKSGVAFTRSVSNRK